MLVELTANSLKIMTLKKSVNGKTNSVLFQLQQYFVKYFTKHSCQAFTLTSSSLQTSTLTAAISGLRGRPDPESAP